MPSQSEFRETDTHIFFYGGIYSQWYKCSFTDGVNTYTSAEQYMMYKKAELFNDDTMAKKILKTSDPKRCKELGRQISNFDNAEWQKYSYNIVSTGNFLKFSQNEHLKDYMLSHRDKILVEASPYDKIWGIGLSANNDLVLDESKWLGENKLGKAIMAARIMVARPKFYNSKGEVAILYSPDFYTGWYTGTPFKAMIYDPFIVQMVMYKRDPDDIIDYCNRKYGSEHCYEAARNLKIRWLPEGTRFRIEEYDGSESIIVYNENEYLEA